MKLAGVLNLGISLLGILAGSQLCGQGFLPIPSSGALFRMESSHSNIGPNDAITFPFLQYTSGDTLIDSLWVTQVVHDDPTTWCRCIIYTGGLTCPGLMNSYWTSSDWKTGYLLQDTSAGKVYWKLPGSPPVLQFDFAAMPGDTITTQWIGSPPDSVTYFVDSVDVVTYADGIPRRRVWVHHFFEVWIPIKRAWVEGVGDLYQGFLPQKDIRSIGTASYFVADCYEEDGLFLTGGIAPHYWCALPASCSLTTDASAAHGTSAAYMQTNPSSVLELIGLPAGAVVTIHSTQGEPLSMKGDLRASQDLPNGIYWVRAMDAGRMVFQGKWMKLD